MLFRAPAPAAPVIPPGWTYQPQAPAVRKQPVSERIARWLLRKLGLLLLVAVLAAGSAVGRRARNNPRGAVIAVTVACSAATMWTGSFRLGLIGGGACFIASWIVEWRIARTRPIPARAVHVPDERVAIWRTVIAREASVHVDPETGVTTRYDAGPIPGCMCAETVEDVRDDHGTPTAWRLHVRGRDVEQHVGAIALKKPAIAAAYQTLVEAVTVVPDGDHSRAVVQVVPATVFRQKAAERQERLMTTRTMTGPHFDPAAGIVTLGHLADDGTPMQWTVFVPGQGIRHGWIIGGTGSGKSALVSNLLASMCSQGICVPHVADLAGGASVPEWDGVAASFATTPAEAVVMLRRVEREFDARQAYMRARKLKVMTPSREHPILPIVVEESTELAANREAMRIIERLIRLGRKVLIAIIWVSQSGDAAKVFGDAGTLMRQQLKAGNIIALFLTGESVGQALSGARDGDRNFDPDTVMVPKDTPGACAAWTPQHKTPVLGRAWHLDDESREHVLPTWLDIPADPMWRDVLDSEAAAAVAALEAPDADIPEEVKGNARTILEVVRREGWVEFRTGAVIEATGLAPSSVNYALKALVDRRQVNDLGYGNWSAAA